MLRFVKKKDRKKNVDNFFLKIFPLIFQFQQ
jgi:hypothetical protein